MLAGFGNVEKNISELLGVINVPLIGYGAGRGEFGTCLHLPFQAGYNIAASSTQNRLYLINTASLFSIWTNNLWDYKKEEVEEVSVVCSENPSSGGILLYNQESAYGPKVQVFLDRTFGVKEISVGWKGGMALDETLVPKFKTWLTQKLKNLGAEATEATSVTKPRLDIVVNDDFLRRGN